MQKKPSKALPILCLCGGAWYCYMTLNTIFATNIYETEGWWKYLIASVVLLIAAFFLYRRYRQRLSAYEQAQAAAAKADSDAREEKARAERQAEEASRARQEEWQRTHGQIFTKLSGVTFDNPDGSSRQKLLKAAMANDCIGELGLDVGDYNGREVVYVLFDDEIIGLIPKPLTAEVIAVLDRVSAMSLSVESFRPDDDDDDDYYNRRGRETIYRADLTIVYTRDGEAAP